MKVQNSYIFLNNPNFKKMESPHSDQGYAIVLDIGNCVTDYVKECFPEIEKREADNGSNRFFRNVYSCMISDNGASYKVTFVINEVIKAEHLDVTVEGKSEVGVIRCLEMIHSQLLSTDIGREYIPIVTYDAVSEYYCNKILPKLNNLERNLRKLLFSTYVVNYGTDYYRTTISDEMQAKAKGRIQAKGSEQKKEIKRLQEFFYSLEMAEIQKILFTPQWTDVERISQKEFLQDNPDLSSLSDEELRNAFNRFTPKSDWERFFSKKIPLPDIQNTIDAIRQYRNKAAHFKFYTRADYETSKRLIKTLNDAVIRAIHITEDKDFTASNAKAIQKAVDSLSKAIRELGENLQKTISKGIASVAEMSIALFPGDK